jgi:DNA-binding LacI/PurR family transcriptional regulator
MTTLKDIAGLAGMSTATASLALNEGKVSEVTRQRVLAIAQTNSFPYIMFRPARFGADVNYVDIENAEGGRLVANLFTRLGHSKIAMINGPDTHVDAIERERGFREGLSGARYLQGNKEERRFPHPKRIFCYENDFRGAKTGRCLLRQRLHGRRRDQVPLGGRFARPRGYLGRRI